MPQVSLSRRKPDCSTPRQTHRGSVLAGHRASVIFRPPSLSGPERFPVRSASRSGAPPGPARSHQARDRGPAGGTHLTVRGICPLSSRFAPLVSRAFPYRGPSVANIAAYDPRSTEPSENRTSKPGHKGRFAFIAGTVPPLGPRSRLTWPGKRRCPLRVRRTSVAGTPAGHPFRPCGTQSQNDFVPGCHKAIRYVPVCHKASLLVALCAC